MDLLILYLTIFYDTLISTFTLPILPNILKEMGVETHLQSGLRNYDWLIISFYGAQFLGYFFWGNFLKQNSIKYTLLLSLFANIIANTLFGLSSNFCVAIFFRALTGFTTTSSVLARRIIFTNSDHSQRYIALICVGAASTVLSIVGSAEAYQHFPAIR